MTDKLWQLYESDPAPFEKEVAGLKVFFKGINNAKKAQLCTLIARIGEDEQSFYALMKLVGRCIDHIEGFEGQDPVDVVPRLKDISIQTALIKVISEELSSLSGEETKNSLSSSAG